MLTALYENGEVVHADVFSQLQLGRTISLRIGPNYVWQSPTCAPILSGVRRGWQRSDGASSFLYLLVTTQENVFVLEDGEVIISKDWGPAPFNAISLFP